MLNATVQKLGDSTGDAHRILRNAVLRQTHTRALVLDLAKVDRRGRFGCLAGST